MLGIGLLGAGRIGQLHGEIISQQLTDTELVTVYDQHPAAAHALAQKTGAEVADSVDTVLSNDRVDAVAICTPTNLHAEQIIAAAAAGKAIFTEKPVSLEVEDMDRALTAVASSGVPFQIGFNQRFDTGHATLARAVRRGQIGEPQIMRISSRDTAPPGIDYARTSGGIFLDMTIHDLDLARFIVNSEVTEVFATGGVLIDAAFHTIGDLDTAVLVLTHANGCLTTIDNSRQSTYGYDQRVEIFGSQGIATSENRPEHAAMIRDKNGSHGARIIGPFIDRYRDSYIAEWKEFTQALATHRPPSVGLDDARQPLLIGLAANQSVRDRRPVRIDTVS